ncbi:protein AAR2 homolog [Artemia franciscana]|uniref:Protein AAR2 homolog n=1 Tax=Artemia franciscana TaxID=6661 RepID=A0AA88LFU8_ARTSF|nr:hypothetical protein QYM36_004079 [Artemia franciscana]
MDQETAKTLFKEGCVLFLMEYPIGSEIGIDLQSWNVGEKFRGIKMIPPGMHFIYYSVSNKTGQIAPRTGFFVEVNPKEVIGMKWNALSEDFEYITSAEELEPLKTNLENLDPFLGPYPYDTYKRWISLSHRVSKTVVEKLEPLSKRITSVADLIPSKKFEQKHRHRNFQGETTAPAQTNIEPSDKPLSELATSEEFLLPEMHHRPGTNLRFSEIPTRRYPEGASSAEITQHSLDSSYVLEQLWSQWDNPNQLLGELQMAFLAFLVGQSYLGFEHWKQLILTISTSDRALLRNPDFFIEFLNDLYFQLSEVSEDFFVDIVSQDNFLVHSLRTLFSNIREINVVKKEKGSSLKKLRDKADKMVEHLQTRFNWDFQAEPEDESPVIVADL